MFLWTYIFVFPLPSLENEVNSGKSKAEPSGDSEPHFISSLLLSGVWELIRLHYTQISSCTQRIFRMKPHWRPTPIVNEHKRPNIAIDLHQHLQAKQKRWGKEKERSESSCRHISELMTVTKGTKTLCYCSVCLQHNGLERDSWSDCSRLMIMETDELWVYLCFCGSVSIMWDEVSLSSQQVTHNIQ